MLSPGDGGWGRVSKTDLQVLLKQSTPQKTQRKLVKSSLSLVDSTQVFCIHKDSKIPSSNILCNSLTPYHLATKSQTLNISSHLLQCLHHTFISLTESIQFRASAPYFGKLLLFSNPLGLTFNI